MTVTVESHELYDKHEVLLRRALTAIAERTYWSPYPESPSPRVYGEGSAAEGRAAFDSLLGREFPLDDSPTDRAGAGGPGVQRQGAGGPGAQRQGVERSGAGGWIASESSPFGIPLEVRYPRRAPADLVAAAAAALPAWRDAGPRTRAGVCLEILATLHAHVFELAYAVQFTTGQAFVMAFQAGGTHALDRGLEAVAYAFAEQTRAPAAVVWEKPAGKGAPLRMAKTFHVAPRGVALVIGCNTFPTWNGYPGLFASLATGNPVIVKPHPNAVLPLAITVRIARQVLRYAGFDPDLVQLAAEEPGESLASDLAVRPEVKIVDFTGSTGYGEWLETNARQAVVYTEKAGVNTVIVDSTDDFVGMCRNIAFSLTLYSGQMCTTPQNVLVPRDGIETEAGHRTYREVAEGIADAVRKLTADDARAVELTGAIVNAGVLDRLARAAQVGEVVLASRRLSHPEHPDAVARTPLILAVDSTDESLVMVEWFGPISFVVGTGSTAESIELFRRMVGAKGALTAAVYSTSNAVLDEVEGAALDVGVHLSANLTGAVFVNQSAAFSDFHATGANPAANAALTDGAFVANRFRIVQSRAPLPAR